MRHYTRAHIDREASTPDGPLRVVAATEGVKGDGIDLRMTGARLDRFRMNPVLGFGHAYWGRTNLPVGRCSNIRVEGGRLLMDVEFDDGDPFAMELRRKYLAGVMNAFSIGFEVTKWQDDKGDYYRGGVAEEWELLELSCVPVPMDASAVVQSGRDQDAVLVRALRALLDAPTVPDVDQPTPPAGADPTVSAEILTAVREAAAAGALEVVERLTAERDESSPVGEPEVVVDQAAGRVTVRWVDGTGTARTSTHDLPAETPDDTGGAPPVERDHDEADDPAPTNEPDPEAQAPEVSDDAARALLAALTIRGEKSDDD
jgi:HK97 family phage prohead protease